MLRCTTSSASNFKIAFFVKVLNDAFCLLAASALFLQIHFRIATRLAPSLPCISFNASIIKSAYVALLFSFIFGKFRINAAVDVLWDKEGRGGREETEAEDEAGGVGPLP